MAPTPSLRVIKEFQYKGTLQRWSNRYHFLGGTPSDNTHWNTFMDNVVSAERAIHADTVTIVEAIGYNAGSELPVHSKAYVSTGQLVTTGGVECPGDCAVLVRYNTTARSVKNHPIYLFNYYHAVFRDLAGGPDALLPGEKAALENYTQAWLTGYTDGQNTYVRAGPNGASATSRVVEALITHRDFPD